MGAWGEQVTITPLSFSRTGSLLQEWWLGLR